MQELFFSKVTKEIREIIETEEAYLTSLNKDAITSKFNSQKRSIKQIVGHMIDSASNNLHRLVHLQYNETPLIFPDYSANGNNDRWIAIQNYQHENWMLLINLWKYSNLHLIHVIEHIDLNKMDNKWLDSQGEEVSLKNMVMDYPRHLKLHINEIHELYNS